MRMAKLKYRSSADTQNQCILIKIPLLSATILIMTRNALLVTFGYLNMMKPKDVNMAKLVKEEYVCIHTMIKKRRVCVMKMMKMMTYVDVQKLMPVFEKVKLAVENGHTLIEKCSFKCKHCDFEAKDNNKLNMHIRL